MLQELLDTRYGWYVLVVALPVTLYLAAEIGYRAARLWTSPNEDARAQTATVAASLLGLLGFLLAFTFGMADTRFQQRRGLVLDEANAIGTTYLRTDFLPEPERTRSREMLAEYVDVRIDAVRDGDVEQGLERSAELHRELWAAADEAFRNSDLPISTSLYVQSLNNLIDLDESRVIVVKENRIPPSIMTTLYVVGLVSVGLLALNFGMYRQRARVGVVAIVVALSALLLLIVDLDQPRQRLFTVSQQALVDVQQTIRGSSSASSAPGEAAGGHM